MMDVGANVGHHTLFASGFAARVHAFEPFEPVRAALVEKIEVNRLDNVEVHPFGLGDRNTSLPFHAPLGPNQGTGSFMAEHTTNTAATIQLPIVVGDEFAQRLARLDLIKIDVEGFERQVLAGLKETLERLRPAVLFEYSDTTRKQVPTVDGLMALFPREYQLFAVETRRVILGVFEFAAYRLLPLRLGETGPCELLAMPAERIGSLEGVR